MIFNSCSRVFVLSVLAIIFCSCSSSNDTIQAPNTGNSNGNSNEETPIYASIDFTNWKVTLPVDENNNGSPDEYQPEDLVNFGYQTLDPVIPFMYDDIEDSSIVFYTYPDVSTTNSSYSRTELRELINVNNARENWTLDQGGELTGRLKVESISQDSESSNDYHRVIVMQIHGIISEEDMDIHGFSSNNGPPLLKMYWKDGYLWAHKKSLVDEDTLGDDLLDTSSETWHDIKYNMGYVGFDAFDLNILATQGQLEIRLNQETPLLIDDISLEKWPFENYFKAGNYLASTDANAFSMIKYYNLTVTH
ncbi:polysaccharide lyase family 7 protein [Hanstruepera ponticola]|uniref:polysaccharide lyase family 7 protein n=1 Tax=Hanstruepera ponticola TaxID=2042995 RepID=UPI000CF0ED58|nr:polysaccharide lyase family 7 protein [Hanstruepera ponticola]